MYNRKQVTSHLDTEIKASGISIKQLTMGATVNKLKLTNPIQQEIKSRQRIYSFPVKCITNASGIFL